MGKIGKTRSERGGAKRRRTVLFQDGLGALSVAAFLFLGATIREVNLLMALGAFFAGFAVLDYWQGRRSLRRLRVARRLPDAIFAEKPFEVEIEIDATQRRSSAWGVVVEDEWTRQEGERALVASPKQEKTGKIGGVGKEGRRGNREGSEKEKKGRNKATKVNAKDGEAAQNETRPTVAATARPTAYFPRVKGGERRRERYCGVVARRGVRRLATLTASTRFPFGFFRSSERFDAPDEILVFPKIGVLTERWNAEFGVARRETTVSTARTSRIAGKTLTVRDWRPDDSKRAIHWRATAKRGQLQARDFEKRDNSVKILILDLFFDKANGLERGLNLSREQNGEIKTDAQSGEFWEKGEKAQKRKGRKTAKEASGTDASESVRRSALVEKAVSFAATLIERWTRSNDAKLLLAINGDAAAFSGKNGVPDNGGGADGSGRFEKAKKMGNLDDLGRSGAWDGRVESGSGAFRRALTRLATVETPRRDRLPEIAASLDPRVLANAQIFIVSVAPLDGARLAENESGTDKMGEMREIDKAEKPGEAEAVASGRGIGGRWRDARLIDASAFDFDDYFEF
ncbi:MAG: DUF58 domain-containing protein [Thermoguttaceae bacterium]|nr:DUF58 domain-containing protein [Thermoguttaceae bacterium]